MNTVAFFCDKNVIPGLHAALSSLLINNFSNDKLHIVLFGDCLKKKEKTIIFETFNKLKRRNQSFEIREAPKMKIPDANALVGNFTAYGRLFLGELLPETNCVLYLDSDIIVNLDVKDVFEQMSGDDLLFVSCVGERNWSLDKVLYKKAALKMEGLCFNSGVLGINLKKWRAENAYQKCIDTIKKFPNQFLSADQAVLNVAFNDDFKILSENINIGALGSYKKELGNGIYHFIGLPKPWHPLMKKYHKNYFMWERYIKQSALNFNPVRYFNLVNTVRIINSYRRILFSKKN